MRLIARGTCAVFVFFFDRVFLFDCLTVCLFFCYCDKHKKRECILPRKPNIVLIIVEVILISPMVYIVC